MPIEQIMNRRAFGSRLLGVAAAMGVARWPPAFANPILAGWYADPEVRIFEGEYWIYPTYSAPYDQQLWLDAFSSTDLVTWTKHERVLDAPKIAWARRAIWAPSVLFKDGWYYLF